MDAANAQFNLWHMTPTVTLPAGTSLTNAEAVSIDYYGVHPVQAGTYYQTGACLTEAEVQDYVQTNIANVSALLPPETGYFLGYDEMRHMGSCSLCVAQKPTAGQLLAWHIGYLVQTIHSANPNTNASRIYIWSDMFDPNHNAVTNYYLVPTTIANSWLGVPCGTTIMNWLKTTPSLQWFSGLNFPQIIAGYYDSGDGTTSANAELANAKGIPGIQGFMYSTFESDYSQLQEYAAAVLAGWASTISSSGDSNYFANCLKNAGGGQSSSAASRLTSFWA